MKSVGEVMAIGRTFQESLQKALRGLETGLEGLDEIEIDGLTDPERPRDAVLAALARPTPDRIRVIAQAFRLGFSVQEVHRVCQYDPWFLEQIRDVVATEEQVRRGRPAGRARRAARAEGAGLLRCAAGAADRPARGRRCGPIGYALGVHAGVQADRHLRGRVRGAHALSLQLLRARCSATLESECEAQPSDRRKVMILGGGPEPDRPGHRVRLLLLPCRFRARRRRARDHHGQLQSRDRLDRLRHLRPAVLRAADGRGRARDRAGRGECGRALRRDRPARRPDPAQARRAARGGGRADPRHLARCDRSRRGSRAVPEAAGAPEAASAGQRRLLPSRRGACQGACASAFRW